MTEMPDQMRLAIINAVASHARDPIDIYSLSNIIADAIQAAMYGKNNSTNRRGDDMTDAEPEDYAQVAVVPYEAVWILAGTTAEVEVAEFTVIRNLRHDSFTLMAERDSKKIKVTVSRRAFKHFLAQLTDLAQ